LDFNEQKEALQAMPGLNNALYPHLSLARMMFIAAAVLAVIVIDDFIPGLENRQAGTLQCNAIPGAGRQKIQRKVRFE